MKSPAPTQDEWKRVRQLECDVVNLAYHEQYEQSCAAADELVALAGELLDRYGPIPELLALRAQHAANDSNRLDLWRATYHAAEAAGDGWHRGLAAYALAADSIGSVPSDLYEGERWLAIAEQEASAIKDVRFADELDQLRGILKTQKRKTMGVPMPKRRPRGRRTRR